MGVRKICFWTDRAKMHPKSLPLRTPFWMKNERRALWERNCSLNVLICPTSFQYFSLSHPLLAHHPFSILCKICNNTLGLYILRTPSLGHVGPPKRTSKIQKRASRCMRTLPENGKRVPRCMGTCFWSGWSRLVSPKGCPKNVPNRLF